MSRHSNDLRERVIQYYKEVKSKTKTIKVFKIARQTIYDWITKEEKGDLYTPTNYNRRVSKFNIPAILEYVKQNPDRYNYEIGEVFNCSPERIRMILKNNKITVKKNKQNTEKLVKLRNKNLEN
jgi:transposase